jgi:hypothetical protein
VVGVLGAEDRGRLIESICRLRFQPYGLVQCRLAGSHSLLLDTPIAGTETMNKIIKMIVVAAVLAACIPAVSAQQTQQTEPAKQTLRQKLKEKYLARRAKFMARVKDAYFAVGCKVLAREAGILPLTSNDTYLAYICDQTIVDLKDDEARRQAAMQEGLDRAAKPGECDYYRKHPEAAEAIRKQAADAAAKTR